MITEQKRRVLDHFADGRRHYKLMNFEEALASFEQALQIDPSDGPARVYAERCRHYIESPPPEDWDGVFVMQTK